jgi:serine/threonine-protein kinase
VSISSRSEDARSFFQHRLTLTYLVGFAVSTTFVVGYLAAHYAVDHPLGEALRERAFHIAATALLGAIWWWLAHRRVRYLHLEVVDTAAIVLVTLLLSVNAGLHPDRTVSVFRLALATGFVAIIRAVIVPSTARRTLVLGLLQCAAATAVFFLSAFHPAWPVAQRENPEWPLAEQLATLVLWAGGLVAVATVASQVIYRLRSEVRAARQLGQYVLGEKVGEGGMGIVYRATHALLRRETALKLLPPDRVDPATIRRFEREVVETARLRHPNTVAIYDYGRTPDGVFYYAMEYLDGFDLGELIAAEGPLPPGRVVGLLAQVLASLEEAHAIGLVHRDIKPANVMVVGNTGAYDLVKVLDFGLVKSEAPLDGGTSLTDVGRLTGTPLYMAPEAIVHPEAAEPRSDLYAAAAVGYFMLTGQHVFTGGSMVELLAAHLHRPPPPMRERLGREVPLELEALLLRGLSKAPADRPPSAAAFRDALSRCDVPPWTQEDARAWWLTRGDRARRAEERGRGRDVAYVPTVSVVREGTHLH